MAVKSTEGQGTPGPAADSPIMRGRRVGMVAWAAICLAVAVCIAPAFCAGASGASKSPDRAYVDSVIDSLVKAGVLTTEQATQIKGDASQAAAKVAKALAAAKPAKKSWADSLKVHGYTQAQFDDYLDAPNPAHKAGKPSNEFLVRRARIEVSAQPSDRTDFFFEAGWDKGTPQLWDVWLQRYMSADRSLRARVGLQKVPFGFEIPQPGGHRIPFEHSYQGKEFPSSRDTGAVLYYTTPADHALFARSQKDDWGDGDYGNFAIGVFNGQGGHSTAEADSQKGLVLRACKPFEFGANHNYAELGASYWDNDYVSSKVGEVHDRLYGLHGYIAPHPLGLLAEYDKGKTEGGDMTNWYAMGLWHPLAKDVLYLRYNKYDGRVKGGGLEPYDRHSTTLGIQHMLDPKTRLTLEYEREHVLAEPLFNQAAYDNDQLGMRLTVYY